MRQITDVKELRQYQMGILDDYYFYYYKEIFEEKEVI